MNYKLELKQIVDFPRCRIYRDFIQTLIHDKNIRISGGSYLFYYIILYSYVNYRTSYRRLDGITYTVSPVKWLCPIADLQSWFRCRFQHQTLSILKLLEERHYITHSTLGMKKPNSRSLTGPKTIHG